MTVRRLTPLDDYHASRLNALSEKQPRVDGQMPESRPVTRREKVQLITIVIGIVASIVGISWVASHLVVYLAKVGR